MRIVGVVLMAALAVGVTVGAWLWVNTAQGENFGEAAKSGIGQPLLMAALMICGIAFGTIYNELRDTLDTPLAALRRALTEAPLYRSLLVAPLVFAGVYTFARSATDPVVIAIFAFQNGFFCEAIFRKSAAAGQNAPPRPPRRQRGGG